ncbi:hypothetical protein BGX30_012951 [Mortierella sp. GBA39]|nr:hypothetical protein BGX30_012951 [Mortierella sp. GBA39]
MAAKPPSCTNSNSAQSSPPTPTVGLSAEYLTTMGIEFVVWDLAGTWGNRSIWHHAAQGAIICVIDSTDLDQVEETKRYLWRMCEHYDVQEKECPLLAFANKQDCLGALIVSDMKGKLESETRSQGPTGGGKATILYKLHLGKVVSTIPAHDFNMETITIEGTKFALWDLAGSWFPRVDLWSRSTDGIAAMVFVIDSTDAFQIEQAKTATWAYYRDYDTMGVEKAVMLVLANKQDCQEPQVLVVGIEGSGRHTFVQQLNLPGGGGITTKSILTTLSFGCDIIGQDNVPLSLSVYGGNPSMRWCGNSGTAGVVCVVDSSDKANIELTKVTLRRFFERYEQLLRKAVLLVLGNKQGRLDALSVTEVKERLELETRFKGRRWHI